MIIQKQLIKSCCGRSAWVYATNKAVTKAHIEKFKKAGFFVPERYTLSGLFYAKKDGFLATCTFGITKINARCSGNGCKEIFEEFEKILNSL